MASPLPVRNGVNATRLRLPRTGPWHTVADYLLERFGHVDPQGILRRFDDREIVGLGGMPLTRQTPLGDHEFIWYYRSLPVEPTIPFEATILHQDEHLIAVDDRGEQEDEGEDDVQRQQPPAERDAAHSSSSVPVRRT